MRTFSSTLAILLLLAASMSRAEQAPSLEVAFDPKPWSQLALKSAKPLPPELRWAWDLRIAGPHSVYLAAEKEGVVELVHVGGLNNWKAVFNGSVVGPMVRLGLSGKNMASSFYAGILGQLNLGDEKARMLELDRRIDYIADLDVFEDRILLLAGWRRGPRGVEYSPDGSIGMLTTVGSGPRTVTSVHIAQSGPGAPDFLRCALLEVSAVRFLADGSFILSPGFEDGVFWYSSDGALRRVWSARELGVDGGCAVSSQRMAELAAAPELRAEFVNGLVVVDEILPIGEVAALIVREFDGDQVSWSLLHLLLGGKTARTPLPFTSKSPYSRFRGDVRGQEIILLKTEPGGSESTEAPPEILVFMFDP